MFRAPQQAAASSCNAQCVDGRFTAPSRRHQSYPARLFWRSRGVSAPPQSFLRSWITKEELQRFPAPPTRRGNDGRVTSRRALVRRTRASPSGIQPTFRNLTLFCWLEYAETDSRDAYYSALKVLFKCLYFIKSFFICANFTSQHLKA